MSKKRVAIYLEGDQWKDVKRLALEHDQSASELVANLIKDRLGQFNFKPETPVVTKQDQKPPDKKSDGMDLTEEDLRNIQEEAKRKYEKENTSDLEARAKKIIERGVKK
jgi:hypothetical protein